MRKRIILRKSGTDKSNTIYSKKCIMGEEHGLRPVSYKGVLLEEISVFLEKNDMSCETTACGVCELVCRLLNYKEESKALFPEIYIIDDPDSLKLLSGGDTDRIILGEGDKTAEMMLRALKKGAPLCERYWAIYILRLHDSDHIEYGVFKKEDSLVSLASADMINADLGVTSHIIQLQQITSDIILLKGCASEPLLIQFGPQELTSSPLDSLDGFVKKIILKMNDDGISEKANHLLRRVFCEVKENGHGTLACVVDGDKEFPDFLSDGVKLETPINIISPIIKVQDMPDNNSLEALFSLISGMLKSDGITVFSDNSKLLAYNVFIKLEDLNEDEKTSGGARSRTYLQLKKKVDSGDLVAAYMQTQEGKIEYYGK